MESNDILITTSDNFSNSEIEEHLGIVDSQIVIGANIFRDVFSGFRDIFGGETKGYKKDIDKMKNAALSNIKNQAREKGANSIISLRIDLDEVSGGGKSMFMINVYGTAVKLSADVRSKNINEDLLSEISLEDLDYYKEKNNIKNEIKNTENILVNVDLKKISEFKLWNRDISKKVLYEALEINLDEEKLKLKGEYYFDKIDKILSEMPTDIIEDFLSNHMHQLKKKYWNIIYDSLKSRNWYNYEILKQLLNDDNYIVRFRALKLCLIEKDFYESSDSQNLKHLGAFLRNDFDETVETEVKRKMINKKEVYTCPGCLEDTPITLDRCHNCGANRHGLKSGTPDKIVDKLIETAEAIETAFSEIDRKEI